MTAEVEQLSWPDAVALLEQADARYAATLNRNDYRRLIRALVIFEMTGKPLPVAPDRNSVSRKSHSASVIPKEYFGPVPTSSFAKILKWHTPKIGC